MSGGWWRGISVGMAILLLAAFGGPAAAGDEEIEDQIELIAAQEQNEVESLAAHWNITVDEAQAWTADRAAVDDLVASIQGGDLADTFAGVYFTHDDGQYVLHIIRTASNAEAEIVAPKTTALSIVYEQQSDGGDMSYNDLQSLSHEIFVDYVPAVRVVHTNEQTGKPVVRTDDETAAAISEEYGHRVAFDSQTEAPVTASCASETNCQPWRGGIRINGSQGSACSFGFNVSWNSNGNLKMITAGHCGYQTWTHHGDTVGATGPDCATVLLSLDCNQPIDAERANNNNTYGTPRNCVLWDLGHGLSCYYISGGDGTRHPGFMAHGDPVDFHGATTGYHYCYPVGCVIDDESTNWIVNCDASQEALGCLDTLSHGFTINQSQLNVNEGDSGGPAFGINRVFGILSALDTWDGTNFDGAFVTYAYDSVILLNSSVCINSNCS